MNSEYQMGAWGRKTKTEAMHGPVLTVAAMENIPGFA